MPTVSFKISDAKARELRRRAKRMGITPSAVVRMAVEEYLAPPSQEWAKEFLKLPRLKRTWGSAEALERDIAEAGL